MLDRGRQWVKSVEEARLDHQERYKFAAKIAKGTVLDAACGCGYGSHYLMNSGLSVTGVDIDEGAIDWALKNFPGPDYRIANIETDDLPECNTVVSFETIEHLRRPQEFLRRIRGNADLLICSTPNEERYKFRPENFVNDEYPHFRHYTPEEFDLLLEGCGWTVVERCCQVSKVSGISNGTDGMFLVYVCK